MELLELVLVVVFQEVGREEVVVLEDHLMLLVVHVVQRPPKILLALEEPVKSEQLVDFVLLFDQLSLEDFDVMLVDDSFRLVVGVDSPLAPARRKLFWV